MRLSKEAMETIKQTAREVFGPGVSVVLFGSRVDDSDRGGDIDLLVESPVPLSDPLEKCLQLEARLQMKLGDQRIDVLVVDPGRPRQPIHEEALRTGVQL